MEMTRTYISGHAACTYVHAARTGTQHRLASRTCSSMDKQQWLARHAARTCSKEMQHGSAAWTSIMDKHHGHTARTLNMDIKLGHTSFRFKNIQHGHAARTWHVAWTWAHSIDIQREHAAKNIQQRTCSKGHVVLTWPCGADIRHGRASCWCFTAMQHIHPSRRSSMDKPYWHGAWHAAWTC
jgi:hypothetical protein